jgi:hypothetical protein
MLQCDRCHEAKDDVEIFAYKLRLPSKRMEYKLRDYLETDDHKIPGFPKLCHKCQRGLRPIGLLG